MKKIAIVTCDVIKTLEGTSTWNTQNIADKVSELKRAGMSGVEVVSIYPTDLTYMATIRYEDGSTDAQPRGFGSQH